MPTPRSPSSVSDPSTATSTETSTDSAPRTATALPDRPIPAPASIHDADHMEKIRDILFGPHLRAQEREFRRIDAEILRLRDETQDRLDALEALLLRELSTLRNALREQAEQGAVALAERGAELDRDKLARSDLAVLLTDLVQRLGDAPAAAKTVADGPGHPSPTTSNRS